jgi:hypothetical protein
LEPVAVQARARVAFGKAGASVAFEKARVARQLCGKTLETVAVKAREKTLEIVALQARATVALGNVSVARALHP